MSRRISSLLILAALVVALGAARAWAFENCNGIGYFALQWPSGSPQTVDGLDGDWTWFDPSFIIGADQLCNTKAPMPPKSDIDFAIRIGWTPEPDNRLYAFVRVIDDTLNVDGPNLEDAWNDDALELITNTDHGEWHPENDSALRTGLQQWSFQIPTPGGYPQLSYLRFQQPPEMQWAINQGLVEAAADVKPEARHLATNVDVGYEVRMPAWNFYSQDGEGASTRHIFTAGQVIGLSVIYNEADTGGRTDQIATHIIEAGAHDSDFMSEFTLLSIGEYATAVESNSWGAIKALLR